MEEIQNKRPAGKFLDPTGNHKINPIKVREVRLNIVILCQYS